MLYLTKRVPAINTVIKEGTTDKIFKFDAVLHKVEWIDGTYIEIYFQVKETFR